ncbi:MAG: radical SAM protein [Firmicutes bacterium]|nr:radical SAM protein [Bacillota bacterium]
MPQQAGHDEVLKRMRRPYTLAEYRGVVDKVRERIPDVAITTDIIVGFPGETDGQFEAALKFVGELAFSRLHVFRYSPRRGTPAAGFPDQVPTKVKNERSQQMIQLGKELSRAFHQRFIDGEVEVLWEEAGIDGQGDLWQGHTPNYVMVKAYRRAGSPGDIERVSITGADEEGIWGAVVETA